MVVDWAALVPIIVQIVGPRVLNAALYRLKDTPEAEKGRIEKLLQSVSNEVFRLSREAKRKSKSETVEKLRELWNRLNSQEYQITLGPPVAGTIMRVLEKTITGKKHAIPKTLEQLRKVINTWIHNLRVRDIVPSI